MGFSSQPVAACDAPSCRKQTVAPNDVLPTSWVEGTVRDTNDENVAWIACSDGHIKPAVLAVIDGSNHNDTNAATTLKDTP